VKPSLGKFMDGGAAIINLPRLLETRMLIQANSGGGKSWAIRRLLEQTAGRVQQLVIDPEGEFATLREKHDYVIAAPHDGDALAHPRTAQILARRLLETGVSAILDIYDLKAHERQAFVRIFCETLVNAPKALWQPVLIVLDECHSFCPEAGKAESAGAVIDLATRGRKRGYALIAATQRLAKLHKDAAAELLNKLVGRTGLDVDVKRAADELGMTPRDAMEKLRPLLEGEFFAFGPALSLTVRQLKVGGVTTTHPKAGARTLKAPPKPTAAIVAILPKLADLPKEAEAEARTLADLKRELATARRELAAKKPAPALKFFNPQALKEAEQRGMQRGLDSVDMAQRAILATARAKIDRLLDTMKPIGNIKPLARPTPPASVIRRESAKIRPRAAPPAPISAHSDSTLTTPQQKLLDKLLWLDEHGLHPVRKETLAAVASVSPTSGGYFNNLGALRTAGLIEYPRGGEVGFTDAGRALARPSDDSRAVHEHWLDVVSTPQRAILEALIARHPDAIEKDALAELVNVSPTSGGYFNNLGRLRTLGAVDYPQPGRVALTRHVMP
jgi:uncharacterized protein DUF87